MEKMTEEMLAENNAVDPDNHPEAGDKDDELNQDAKNTSGQDLSDDNSVTQDSVTDAGTKLFTNIAKFFSSLTEADGA